MLKPATLAAMLLLCGASPCWAARTLTQVVDVPLPGRPSRFDYQSFDATTGTLYLNHMGDGELVVFDTATRKVTAHLKGFPTATGVLVVPELHRVFVSVAGRHQVAVIDTGSLEVLARVPAGDFPDGLAYAVEVGKVYVSDEMGAREIVIDADANRRLGTIEMGGEVGNTQYDPASGRIFANVQSRGQLVAIDPRTDTVGGWHTLEGCSGPHGLLIVDSADLAFIACEDNAKLFVVDLESFQVKQTFGTGDGPDVLAFDPGLQRLYVASESGTVSVLELHGGALTRLEDLAIGHRAHSVSVNPENHEVYLPLQDVDGRPVLRIMRPTLDD